MVNLTKNMATLEGGRQILFDWCVVATGSTNGAGVYAQPQSLDIAGRRAELKVCSTLNCPNSALLPAKFAAS